MTMTMGDFHTAANPYILGTYGEYITFVCAPNKEFLEPTVSISLKYMNSLSPRS